MTLTGQSFDLDPKTFTLANMFAMQLHKYKEDIAKVTSCAFKELTIENEIKKLAETWQEQRFELHKYHSVSLRRADVVWRHCCRSYHLMLPLPGLMTACLVNCQPCVPPLAGGQPVHVWCQ